MGLVLLEFILTIRFRRYFRASLYSPFLFSSSH